MTEKELVNRILLEQEENNLMMFQSEFYFRFVKRLYRKCYDLAQRRFGETTGLEEIVEDIVQETFIFSIYNLDKFHYEETWDEKEFFNKLLGWLARIASNKLYDHFKELKENNVDLEDYRYYRRLGLDNEETGDPLNFYVIERPILERALNELIPRDRDILLTYIENDCFINSKKQLPKVIMNALCIRYHTNSVNIRKIKIRSWDRVREFCFLNRNV